MNDDSGGYCRPPRESQFKPGQSGNPGGRPKRAPTTLADRFNQVMDTQTTYHESGQTKVATLRELSCRNLVDLAARGDVGAAESLLKALQQAERHGGSAAKVIRVENWIPDHPGQTMAEKTKAMRDGRHAEPGPQVDKE